jgi:hypothetical protein
MVKNTKKGTAVIGICASVSIVSSAFAKERFAACAFSEIFKVSLKGSNVQQWNNGGLIFRN